MAEMMTIGRFARLTGLSRRALRLYDAIALLSPAAIDAATGYRYYRDEQVLTARRIQILRALEMPLADIRALLAATERAEALARIARHKTMLELRIASGQRALESLRALDQWFVQQGQEDVMAKDGQTFACSFCGKDQGQVARLIAGPKGVFICDECVGLCNQILDPATPKASSPS